MQSDFRRRVSCNDDFFIVKQINEKCQEFNLETHLIFIDYEKAFKCVDRKILWGIMHKRGIPLHLVQTYQSLYQNTKILIDGQGSTNQPRRPWRI